VKPNSAKITFSAGKRSKTPLTTRLMRLAWPISGEFAKGMGQLPSNNKAPEPQDPISKIGFRTLATTPGGIAQFYDRDMTKEMADEGMKAMQQFLSDPTQLDAILQRLEQTRKRIYRK